MRNGLPRSRTIINPDIAGIRLKLPVDYASGFIQQSQQGLALSRRSLEKRSNVPTRHNQRMAGRNRKGIANGQRQIIRTKNAFSGNATEGTDRKTHDETPF